MVLRPSRVLVPSLAVAACALGWWLRGPAALVLALLVGVAVQLRLERSEERRLGGLALQVLRFTEPAGDAPLIASGDLPVEGTRGWRRLLSALGTVADELATRIGALTAERQRAQRLLDAQPVGVLLFTDAGLAYANPSARDLFRIDAAEEPRGLTPLRALASDALAEAVAEAAETGRPVEVEVGRGDRQLRARASTVAAGEIALVVTDVTEARRVEAMRSDFVANASHELKTPVAAMQALAESIELALERDPTRAGSMVGRLRSEAVRLSRLVRDLLDLTRLEEQPEERRRQRIDVGVVAAAQVDRLQELAQRNGVTLETSIEHGASMVATPEDLRLIVANLVANAVQYNRRGGTVLVRVRRDGAVVVLEVEDTGLGIAEADRDRVFERFYRVDKARSRAAGGTGLGLSIVRNAADRHGGRVSVRSVLGEGSTFTVTLPVEGAG